MQYWFVEITERYSAHETPAALSMTGSELRTASLYIMSERWCWGLSDILVPLTHALNTALRIYVYTDCVRIISLQCSLYRRTKFISIINSYVGGCLKIKDGLCANITDFVRRSKSLMKVSGSLLSQFSVTSRCIIIN